jgi:trehalose utilization protein
VADEVVARVHQNVLAGMGLLVLHSGHESKIFQKLMGTSCSLNWRDVGEREVVWTVSPAHPITRGVPDVFIVPQQEMYGEYFDIPQPDEQIFISSFSGGEAFRSGCCFRRGAGRIFYFSPGHETYPVYHQPEIQRVLANGVLWAYSGKERRERGSKGPLPEGWFEKG